MKKILPIAMICMFLMTIAKAQQTDSLYAVTFTLGPAWDTKKTVNDQTYFKEHSARLNQLRKDGVVKVGMRFGGKGMLVIVASSLAAAKQIISADESVINKLFVAEVQKLNVFYDGCLERPK